MYINYLIIVALWFELENTHTRFKQDHNSDNLFLIRQPCMFNISLLIY
jgi:hypothetical protein